MFRFTKIVLFFLSLILFVYFIYKLEYVVILGLISGPMDQINFFNPLFFIVSTIMGTIVGWFFFSKLIASFGFEKKTKFLLVVFVVALEVFSPYYQFKESIWKNNVFCPTLTIHGLVSGLKKSAPENILKLARSMRQRCVLKNFLEKRDQNNLEQIFSEFGTFVENVPTISPENVPLFTVISLNMSYPYFGTEASPEIKIEAFTKTLEGINSIFKKKTDLKSADLTIFDKVFNRSNQKVTKAFNQAFDLYITREYKLIEVSYLSSKNPQELKVSFDFMKLRWDLLKENLAL